MYEHVKQILGPTLGKDEQMILDHHTECPTVKRILQSLEEEAMNVREELEPEMQKVNDNFWTETNRLCKDLTDRGIQLDVKKFKCLMDKAVQAQKRTQSDELENLKDAVIDAVQDDGNVYPTITAENAVTGRITVLGPAMQSLPSVFRKSIVPKVPGNQLYYLDYNAMEPSVFSALSKDDALIKDIQSGDLYNVLAIELFNTEDKVEPSHYRDDIKLLFLATFMYGGDISYNLSKSELPIHKRQWNRLLKKYDIANAYQSEIIDKKQCHSLIGIPYDFNRAEVNIFNRFIQSEAALIFKNMLLNLEKLEQSKNFKMILPVHDAILIEADSFKTANDVAIEMENSFNEAVDMKIAKVTIQSLTSGGDVDDQQ